MKKKSQTTAFKFILSNEQMMQNLDHLKMNDFDRFVRIGEIGKKIQYLSKQNNHEELEELCEKNKFEIPFMKMEIEDAFVSAFNLRNEEVVKYFLQNGFEIENVIPDAVISLCYTLQYLHFDPPTELLELVLAYGANPRYAQDENSDTGLHLACQYGCLPFIKLIHHFGGDINAINNKRETPFAYALIKKKPEVIDYLKKHKAVEKWNM